MIAKQSDDRPANVPGLTLPAKRPEVRRVNWLYTITVDGASLEQRDRLIHDLAKDGIETRPVFHPLHNLPPYLQPDSSYPVAERLGATGISLPTHLGLTAGDITTICDALSRRLRDV